MSIDRTSPLKPVSTIQPRETTDAPVTNTRAAKTTASTSTSVTLSDAQAKLMQPGSSDINLERVEALKLAIRNGELYGHRQNCRCADQRSAARLAE